MNESLFSLEAYQFEAPKELIAQYPAHPRDSARLLIIDRTTGSIDEGVVSDLPALLSPNDAMIFNNTKVIHAALCGITAENKTIQLLLTKAVSLNEWWVLAKPARLLTLGMTVLFPEGVTATVMDASAEGQRLLVFSEPLTPGRLQSLGSIPLPPYIQRKAVEEFDAKRYQTIYGQKFGSVAAPTAGLHFTESLFSRLRARDISTSFVTLHVGTGTFLPIRSPDIRKHQMHTESFEIPEDTTRVLNALPMSSRRLAVGTTSLRVLETVAGEGGEISSGYGETNLFVYPGYNFRFVSSLLTNFHTPGSSLLVLVSAFMGYELMKEAYRKAIERKFRLFSYGDAMLIL